MAVTSTHANTPVDLCSRALILIGAEPITSFEDGTTEALVSVNMYEDVVRTSLVNTRWRFATNQAILNLLTAAPTGRYDRAYQIHRKLRRQPQPHPNPTLACFRKLR